MAAAPTLAGQDVERPSRERETLVCEARWIITRLKAAFVRLGIRSFNRKLKNAAKHLGILRTPGGEPILPTLWQRSSAIWSMPRSSRDKSARSSRYGSST